MSEPRAVPVFFCSLIYALAGTLGVFTGGVWAALAISLAVIMSFAAIFTDRTCPRPATSFILLALAGCLLFAAELPFSAYPEISRHLWLRLISIFLPLLLLTSPRLQAIASPRLIPITAFAMSLGAVALGVELASGGPLLHLIKKSDASLTEYNRGMAHLALLAFPVCAGLWVAGRRRLMLIVALILLLPASLTESHTAKLALLAGALCAGAAFVRPRWVPPVLTALAVGLLGWPFYAQQLFLTQQPRIEGWHNSWRHRMEIWDYLSYRIIERPWLGWGLGTTHKLDYLQPHGAIYQVVTENAPHAHNFVTELWVETGLVGLALGFVFLLMTLRAAAGLHPSLRPFALGGWLAAVIVSLFGFDFWTDALWGAFALAGFVFGVLDQQLQRGIDPRDA